METLEVKTTNLIITPNDSLFFKEARPMNAKGNAIIESEKMPPLSTLLGAIKAMIGRQYGINFQELTQAIKDNKVYKRDDVGINFAELFAFNSPDLAIEHLKLIHTPTKQLLYKAPAHLCYNSKENKYAFLKPSKQIFQTDIGYCHLCELPDNISPGYKPLQNAYLTEKNYKKALNYQQPSKNSNPKFADKKLNELAHISIDQIITKEFHLGIQVGANRQAEEGMLYQNNHIRLKQGFAYFVTLKHPKELNIEAGSVRLGGEGRVAFIDKIEIKNQESSTDKTNSDKKENINQNVSINKTNCNKIALILNKDIPAMDNWMKLQGFPYAKLAKPTDCRIPINGSDSEDYLITAVLPKSRAVGGWDLAKNRPRSMINYLSEGSVYFLELSDASTEKLEKGENIFPADSQLSQYSQVKPYFYTYWDQPKPTS
jgi:CRISPR type III-B/RAMP module-associated protein Cmr3